MCMSRKYKDILLLGRGVFPESKSRVEIFFSLDRVSGKKSHIVTNENRDVFKNVLNSVRTVFFERDTDKSKHTPSPLLRNGL